MRSKEDKSPVRGRKQIFVVVIDLQAMVRKISPLQGDGNMGNPTCEINSTIRKEDKSPVRGRKHFIENLYLHLWRKEDKSPVRGRKLSYFGFPI